MSQEEHHNTVSGLGFTVSDEDLQYVNEYPGDWTLTGASD